MNKNTCSCCVVAVFGLQLIRHDSSLSTTLPSPPLSFPSLPFLFPLTSSIFSLHPLPFLPLPCPLHRLQSLPINSPYTSSFSFPPVFLAQPFPPLSLPFSPFALPFRFPFLFCLIFSPLFLFLVSSQPISSRYFSHALYPLFILSLSLCRLLFPIYFPFSPPKGVSKQASKKVRKVTRLWHFAKSPCTATGTRLPYGITCIPPDRGDIPAFTPAKPVLALATPKGRKAELTKGEACVLPVLRQLGESVLGQ